ncbi:hypothetical protein [Plebeiibacterium sediminum]|uniref:Uncharacterized protein n=1 Tax=Plebeiibacterium sediminum TaxID=2992112 RepID=A0AAE3M1B5_9BACT|nr:hypothetical protein [Plebeiobacterium sediminum]MCW3785022.1 hypothetical protein [Plebeiobacterium sediminum]
MKILMLFVFGVICTTSLYSQDTANSADLKFSSFAAGVDYTSNNSLNGTTSMYSTQPISSVFVSYYHKSGFNLSLYLSNIANSDESNTASTQEYGISLGYDLDITSWLMGSVNYSHYEFSDNSNALKSNYSDLFNLNTYSQIKWWNASIDFGYYSGEANDLYLSFQTGVDFDVDNVFKKGNTLSIQPAFILFANSIDYYNDEAYNNYYFLYEYSQNNPEETVGELLESIENPQDIQDRLISRIISRRPYYYKKISKLDTDLVISDLFKEQSSFNISSLGFSLPIYYQWGSFMVNAGFSVYKPLHQPTYVNEDWTSFTNFGLTYFLSW